MSRNPDPQLDASNFVEHEVMWKLQIIVSKMKEPDFRVTCISGHKLVGVCHFHTDSEP